MGTVSFPHTQAPMHKLLPIRTLRSTTCRMRLARWALLGLLAFGQAAAPACQRSRSDDSIPARRWAPTPDGAVAQQAMPIGTVHAYLVPEGTTASIRSIRQGMLAPLEVLTPETVERVRSRLRYDSTAGIPAAAPAGQQWIHVHAASFGKAELQLQAPSGWSHRVVLGMVYAQPQPEGQPQPLDAAPSGSEPRFTVDADAHTLWLSVPGQVDAGWRVTAGQDSTRFALVRVEQLAVPYGDDARVGLFLVAGRSVGSGVVEIQSQQETPAGRARYRFQVQARPATAC